MNDEDLRDFFAAFAMLGLIHHFDFETYKQDPKRVALWAYDTADAMIAERNRVPEEGIASVVKKRRKPNQKEA